MCTLNLDSACYTWIIYFLPIWVTLPACEEERVGGSDAMASFILCLSHTLPTVHVLCPSPSSRQDRSSLPYPGGGKLPCQSSSSSFHYASRKGLDFSLRFHQTPELRICASVAVNGIDSGSGVKPPVPLPFLSRFSERNRDEAERKVYTDEYELNYDVYASNSMAEYAPPPPPPIPFGGPWEEYYDEVIGEDYVPKQEKPTSSLIKFLEDLNKKMAEDDAKAGKPPRKQFPNKDLDLSYDDGPRFLKPPGQVSYYRPPAPPVMAPLAWVLEGGATPYIKPPKPVKEEVAVATETSGDDVLAESTSIAPPAAAPSFAQGIGTGTSTRQVASVAENSRPVQETQPYQPILLRNRVPPVMPANQNNPEPYQPILLRNRVPPVSPVNQNTPEPYQPILLKNRVPPVSPANQNSPASTYEPNQPILLKNRVPPISPAANQNSSGSSSEPYQPILLRNRVPTPSPTNQNNPGSSNESYQPILLKNRVPPGAGANSNSPEPYQPILLRNRVPPETLANQTSPSFTSEPSQPTLLRNGGPPEMPANQNSPSSSSEPYQPILLKNRVPPVSPFTQNIASSSPEPYQPILLKNRVPPVQSANQNSPVQESEPYQPILLRNRVPPANQDSFVQESQPFQPFPRPADQSSPVEESQPSQPILSRNRAPPENQTNSFQESQPSQPSLFHNRVPPPPPLYQANAVQESQSSQPILFRNRVPPPLPEDWSSSSQAVGGFGSQSQQSQPLGSGNTDQISDVNEATESKLSGDTVTSPLSQFYEPKDGDIVLGVVISENSIKLDLEIGAENPAILPFRDFQMLPQADLESSFFELTSNNDISPLGRSLLVKGANESAFSSGYIETGTVLVAEVQGRTLVDSKAILSYRSLARRVAWNRIMQMMQVHEPVQIEVTQFNEGGLLGYLEGVRAFLPRSELLQRPESTASLKEYLGKVISVAIVQADAGASNIIISELKPWMQKNLTLGSVHTVTVTRVYPYGVQVEIKNTRLRGFVHISNMSNEYVGSVTELFQEGDTLRVMSIKGRNPQQVSFSIAQLESDKGLIFTDKVCVFREADEMAMKYREGLSEEEQILFGPASEDASNVDMDESAKIANMQWLHLGSEKTSA